MTRALVLTACLVVLAGSPVTAQDREISAGWVALGSRRVAGFDGSAGTGTALMQGGEVRWRRSWLGASARVYGARFDADSTATGAGKVAYGDVSAHVGPPKLAIDVGYGRRALSGALATHTWSVVRLGARSRFTIGDTGLSAQVTAGFYPLVSGDNDFKSGGGSDAETRLEYRLPRVPGYLMVGYRFERFEPRFGSIAQPEHISSVIVGLAVSFAR